MVLIVVIIALVLEHYVTALDEYRRADLLHRFADGLLSRSEHFNGWFGVAITLGLFCGGIQLIYLTLLDWSVFLGFLGACVVVTFCFGPKNFHEQIKMLCDSVEAKNYESACWHLEQIKYHPLHEDERSAVVATALQTLFVAVNNRILGVIFWFIVLGPLGAVAYRLSSVYHFNRVEGERGGFYQVFDKTYYLLNWPCARLTALSYAVVGSFTDVISHLKGSSSASNYWPDANENLLVNAGLGALHLDQSSKDVSCEDVSTGLALLRRSVAFWVGVIALMTLAGWLG